MDSSQPIASLRQVDGTTRSELFGNSEIVHAAGGAATRTSRTAGAGHSGLVSRSHEEGIFAQLEIAFESDFAGANADMLGLVGNFLILVERNTRGTCWTLNFALVLARTYNSCTVYKKEPTR